MNSYSAPRVPPKLDKAARDPPDPPQPFPVPFRPPASACGARFFSFFTANTGKTPPEKALPPQRWLVRGHRWSVDRGSAIVRFSQGKTARSGKQGETLPTSTPSDRPGRWKLLVDRHAQLRRRLIQAPSRGAHSPASALRHAHRVRCLAHHALRTPKPQS